MTWIDWLVCAVVECATEEALKRHWHGDREGKEAFVCVRLDWHFSKVRARWLRCCKALS